MTGSVSLGLLYLWKISYAVIEILVLVFYLALFLILACEVDLYFASTTQVIYALTSMSSKATVVCKTKSNLHEKPELASLVYTLRGSGFLWHFLMPFETWTHK